MRHSYSCAMLLVFLVSGVPACSTSPPTHYYLLTTRVPNTPPAPMQHQLTVGVGPLILSHYLDRDELVARTGSNGLNVATYHQWGEPLRDNISRVLEEDLGYRLGTDRIVRLPVKRTLRKALNLDYQIPVAVEKFEKTTDGSVILNARWGVLGKDKKELLVRRSEYRETPAADSYDDQVAAQSAALGRLSEEIATAIAALEQQPSGK